MDINKLLERPSEEILEQIRKKWNEDPDIVENRIGLLRSWCEDVKHLPKGDGSNLLRNFVRYCRCDLETAKKQLERYIVNREKVRNLVPKYEFNEEYFRCLVHRCGVPAKYLTPEGFRFGFLRLPEDIANLDFEKLTHYILAIVDTFTIYDSCAGYIGIYDFQNVTTELIEKINMELLMEAVDFIFNIEPVHIEAVHFINLPKVPETILDKMKSSIKDDMVKKVFVHGTLDDLKQYFPDSVLPKEYGGSAGCIEEFSEIAKNVFLNHKNWDLEVVGLSITQK